MKPMKSSLKMTIFSAVLISAIIFIMYMLLLSDVNKYLADIGVVHRYSYLRLEFFMLFIIAIALAYISSSIIIDRVLNPVRLMISKVKEIGNMNFTKPLQIVSEDDELQEYASAFNDMAQKLSSYIERQKRFISDASHELTTPITVINGHSDMLLRWGKEQPEILENELKIIKAEALRMSELIDSLLLLARSDNGRQSYNFEQTGLSKLIEESIAEAKILAPGFIFEAEIFESLIIKCDEYAIRRVLRIILTNAIKYSGNSNIVEISAFRTHGLVNIIITDYGIGIAPEHLPYIFDRFYRVDDSRTKKTGSSGLGLAIAKEIVQAHGGRIEVYQKIEQGSSFSVILPDYGYSTGGK